MALFRTLLVVLYVVLAGYTAAVIAEHGVNFMPALLVPLAALNWSGQINLDCLIYVLTGAGWIAWRHEFSPGGIALAVVALFGALTFIPYLLIVSARAEGDVRTLLLGRERALREVS